MIDLAQDGQALSLLKKVNFDWVTHIKSVWQDSNYDVSNLHQEQRQRIIGELEQIKATQEFNSPLGLALVGQAGVGKTHLLSAIRKHALSNGFRFILVDMTDTRHFWETVLQGYVSSLQEAAAEGVTQLQKLINFLIPDTNSRNLSAQASASELKQYINSTLSSLAKRDRAKALQFKDTVRALFLLNSDDFLISETGYNWLQGVGVEEGDRATFGFTVTSASHPSEVVEGLSWLMGFQGPSVLAFDQLDSIVTQHHYIIEGKGKEGCTNLSEEIGTSKAIIEEIGGGLSSLRDKTVRTLSIVSCLEATWAILEKQTLATFKGRFHPPLVLGGVLDANIAERIVESRLREVYGGANFSPPHPTYPFDPNFFEKARSAYPRAILQRCSRHINKCLTEQKISKLDSFVDADPPPPPPPHKLDELFADLKKQRDVTVYLEENSEDKLATLLETACECIARENPTPDNVDVAIEKDFSGGQKYPTLHTRIRLIFRNQGDREQHLCLRALQHSNPNAYQARLKGAMTASGIDRALTFRRLIIVRTQDAPGGAKTQQLTKQFEDAGGLFAHPKEDELITLIALQELEKKKEPGFDDWLRDRRPVSQLPFMQDAVNWLFGNVTIRVPKEETSGVNSGQIGNASSGYFFPEVPKEETSGDSGQGKVALDDKLPIGVRLVSQQRQETISIPVKDLTKHTVILAGSGSGKTVLVRRLVEEALLLGIPAIVIDCANDLARMGDRWAAPSRMWSDEDKRKADLYHQKSQVTVWTPGREAGNPLTLEPLPDLAAVAKDAEELEQAAEMARDALQDIVAPGKSETAKHKRGILKAALLYFAQHGGGRLPNLIELLSDLPPEAGGGIADASKKAQAMADSLRAERLNNPLLRQEGAALDPAILFGLDRHPERTRISIINFVGLSSLGAQQQFLNQLFMALFTWIKKNPAPTDKPIRGLLVLDEAKDFVPSAGTTPCKPSLNRLVAQARKYGLGLIFATQAPKSIDHNIIANCSTQFYGRANSPAAIEVIQEQLRQRGGSGQDIARLERGQFYAVSESLAAPTKILTPLCLSYHPSTPLDETEVLKRAKDSRTYDVTPSRESGSVVD